MQEREMKKSNTTLAVAALFLIIAGNCSAAVSDDHLKPSSDYIFSASLYDHMLATVFGSAYDDTVLNVLIAPSFEPERLLSIRRTDEVDEVVLTVPKRQIWAYERIEAHEATKRGEFLGQAMDESEYQEERKKLPGNYRDVPLDRKSKQISATLTERISAVWQAALLAVSHPKKPAQGFDGTGYTFSMWVYGYGVITGSTWSPRKDTDMDSLVALATTLEEYVEGQKTLAEVDSALQRSEERFVIKDG